MHFEDSDQYRLAKGWSVVSRRWVLASMLQYDAHPAR
jgi:hypothetical protein